MADRQRWRERGRSAYGDWYGYEGQNTSRDRNRYRSRSRHRSRGPMRRQDPIQHREDSARNRDRYRSRSRAHHETDRRNSRVHPSSDQNQNTDRTTSDHRRDGARERVRSRGGSPDLNRGRLRERSPILIRGSSQQCYVRELLWREQRSKSCKRHADTCKSFQISMQAILDDFRRIQGYQERLRDLRDQYEERVREAGVRFADGYDKDVQSEADYEDDVNRRLLHRVLDLIDEIDAYLRYQNDRMGYRSGLRDIEVERATFFCRKAGDLLRYRDTLQEMADNFEPKEDDGEDEEEEEQGGSQDQGPRNRHAQVLDQIMQMGQTPRANMHCNNCQMTGHTLADCVKPDEYGYARGCPFHDTMDHDFWKCHERHRLNFYGFFYMFLWLGVNKPQWAWGGDVSIMSLVRDADEEYRPWSCQYTLRQEPDFWRRWDYTRESKQRDAAWEYANLMPTQADQEYAQDFKTRWGES